MDLTGDQGRDDGAHEFWSAQMQVIIRVLDGILKAMDAAVNALYHGLDFIIKALERLSRQLLALLSMLIQLAFTLGPFVGLLWIGLMKNSSLLFWTGASFLTIAALFFIRELMALILGEPTKALDIEPSRRQWMQVIIAVLNMIVFGYIVADIFFRFDIVQYLVDLFSGSLRPISRYRY